MTKSPWSVSRSDVDHPKTPAWARVEAWAAAHGGREKIFPPGFERASREWVEEAVVLLQEAAEARILGKDDRKQCAELAKVGEKLLREET